MEKEFKMEWVGARCSDREFNSMIYDKDLNRIAFFMDHEDATKASFAYSYTYGVGIDPEKVQQCIDALEWAKQQFEKLAEQGKYPDFLLADNGGTGLRPIIEALQNIKLKD